MEHFLEFMDKYFFYLWLVWAVTIVSILLIRGKAAIKMFDDLDLSNMVFQENSA